MLSVKRLDFKQLKNCLRKLKTEAVFYYPFQSYPYLKLFSDNFIEKNNLYLLGVFEKEKTIGVGGFENAGRKIFFIGMKPVVGGESLTDFGDIISPKDKTNEVWSEIVKYFKSIGIKNIQLDYVRDDSPTLSYFNDATWKEQAVSPFIKLPKEFDDYLASLSSKDRHELKRKMGRLEKVPYKFAFEEEINRASFEEFIDLHRKSDPSKKQFMSDEMKDLFWVIAHIKDDRWKVKLSSLYVNEKKAASVLYFDDCRQILLYNSGFDPEFNRYSVGLLSKALMIKSAIIKGYSGFDFLRGDERYKYDLGAVARQLYQLDLTI